MIDPRVLQEPIETIPFEELNSDEQGEVILKYHTRRIPPCDLADSLEFSPEVLHKLMKDAMMWEHIDNYTAIGRHIMSTYMDTIKSEAAEAYNLSDPLLEFEDYGEV